MAEPGPGLCNVPWACDSNSRPDEIWLPQVPQDKRCVPAQSKGPEETVSGSGLWWARPRGVQSLSRKRVGFLSPRVPAQRLALRPCHWDEHPDTSHCLEGLWKPRKMPGSLGSLGLEPMVWTGRQLGETHTGRGEGLSWARPQGTRPGFPPSPATLVFVPSAQGCGLW